MSHAAEANFDSPSSEALEAVRRRAQTRHPKHRAPGFNSLLSLHGMPTLPKPEPVSYPDCTCGHSRSEHAYLHVDGPCGAAFDGCEKFTPTPPEVRDPVVAESIHRAHRRFQEKP